MKTTKSTADLYQALAALALEHGTAAMVDAFQAAVTSAADGCAGEERADLWHEAASWMRNAGEAIMRAEDGTMLGQALEVLSETTTDTVAP